MVGLLLVQSSDHLLSEQRLEQSRAALRSGSAIRAPQGLAFPPPEPWTTLAGAIMALEVASEQRALEEHQARRPHVEAASAGGEQQLANERFLGEEQQGAQEHEQLES